MSLLTMPEVAAQQQAVEQCVAIEDDAERLACYDATFRDPPALAEGAVVIESQRPIPALPSGRQPAMVTFRCEGGQVDVWFAFAGQPVSSTGDIASMTYQVDAGPTTVRTMRASPDNKQLTFGSARDTDTFLENLVGGTNVRVRMTPVRQRSVSVDFRLPEVADEIAALKASCPG